MLGTTGLKAGFMQLLIQFVLQLFVECEHVYRTGGRKKEQNKGKECPPVLILKELSQGSGSASQLLLMGELGVMVAFQPNFKEV